MDVGPKLLDHDRDRVPTYLRSPHAERIPDIAVFLWVIREGGNPRRDRAAANLGAIELRFSRIRARDENAADRVLSATAEATVT